MSISKSIRVNGKVVFDYGGDFRKNSENGINGKSNIEATEEKDPISKPNKYVKLRNINNMCKIELDPGPGVDSRNKTPENDIKGKGYIEASETTEEKDPLFIEPTDEKEPNYPLDHVQIMKLNQQFCEINYQSTVIQKSKPTKFLIDHLEIVDSTPIEHPKRTRRCCVPTCAKLSEKLFSFPRSNPQEAEKWVNILGIQNPRAGDRICHRHFRPTDILGNRLNRSIGVTPFVG